MQRDSRAVIFVHYGAQWRFSGGDLSSWKKILKFFVSGGNRIRNGSFLHYHRRDPPPVQAAGDTIPRASVIPDGGLFSYQVFAEDDVLTVDLAIDRIRDGYHPLVVIQNPANFSALRFIQFIRCSADLIDHHKGQLACHA